MKSALKVVAWALFAVWVFFFAIGGYWFAFVHHNDAIGHQYGFMFIVVMIAARLVIMGIDKAAERF